MNRLPRRSPQGLTVPAALLAAGLAIAWMDSRPNWDDTGVLIGAVALAAAVGGATAVRPWLVALFVAGPIAVTAFPAGVVALGIAMVAAYAVAALRALGTT